MDYLSPGAEFPCRLGLRKPQAFSSGLASLPGIFRWPDVQVGGFPSTLRLSKGKIFAPGLQAGQSLKQKGRDFPELVSGPLFLLLASPDPLF